MLSSVHTDAVQMKDLAGSIVSITLSEICQAPRKMDDGKMNTHILTMRFDCPWLVHEFIPYSIILAIDACILTQIHGLVTHAGISQKLYYALNWCLGEWRWDGRRRSCWESRLWSQTKTLSSNIVLILAKYSKLWCVLGPVIGNFGLCLNLYSVSCMDMPDDAN